MNVSLTNPEMQNLFDAASRLHDDLGSVYPAADGQNGSFFQDREALHLYPSGMFEYAFDTPLQLKAELNGMWAYQKAEYMQSFVNICIVAAFKYQAQEKSAREKQDGISSFIYEF